MGGHDWFVQGSGLMFLAVADEIVPFLLLVIFRIFTI